MWSWEHAIVAALVYSLVCHTIFRTTPGEYDTAVVVVVSVLPDVIDKLLAGLSAHRPVEPTARRAVGNRLLTKYLCREATPMDCAMSGQSSQPTDGEGIQR